jgi:hypothetical protein
MTTHAVKKRRSLTPTTGIGAADPGIHQMRRAGPRREVSERVAVKRKDETVLDGWALNIGRGGLRAILEADLELGEEIEVTVGDETDESKAPLTRRGRVVWIQEESDGIVVGVEFTNASGTHRSAPPSAPDKEPTE